MPWGMPEHTQLLRQAAQSWASLLAGCGAPAPRCPRPSAQRGPGDPGCVCTEQVGGALGLSFVQDLPPVEGPWRVRGARCSAVPYCSLLPPGDSQPVGSINPALTGAKHSLHSRNECEKCGN